MAAETEQRRQERSGGLAGAKDDQHLGYLHVRSGPIAKASSPPPSSGLRLFNEADHLLSEVMPLCFKATRDLLKTCAAAATLGVALAPSNALAVTTWNWSFAASNSFSGSGTFTTADVVPAVNTSYQITGISGTYNQGGTVRTITGLNTSEQNLFGWDGTLSSPILVRGLEDIGFFFAGGSANMGHSTTPQFSPVNNLSDSAFNSEFITSSSLVPVSSPPGPTTAAPGPLPLLGAAAAFQASRRLRSRLSGSLPAA